MVLVEHYLTESDTAFVSAITNQEATASTMPTTMTKNHQLHDQSKDTIMQHQYDHDQATQLKNFEESKLGVKGIVDSGVLSIPSIFIHEPLTIPQHNKTTEQTKPSCTLPIIDLQFGHGNGNLALHEEIVQQIKEAAESWSIFRVVNHGIPQRLLDEVIAGAKGFHEQDDEIKKAMYSRDMHKRVAFSSNYNISSGRPLDWRDTLSCLASPRFPAEEFPAFCRDAFFEYTNEVKKLGSTLFELLSCALGLEKRYLEEMGCAERLCILGNYYPPCPQPEFTLGASSHTDSGFLTVLLQDHVEGLQILRGGQWLDVHPMRGAFIINMGNLMQLITNDKFKSVTHRVIAPKETRVSVAALFRTHYDRGDDKQVFGPIKEIRSDEKTLKYRDVTVEEYVKCLYNKPPELSSVLDCFKL